MASALSPPVDMYANYESKPAASAQGVGPYETRATPQLLCSEVIAPWAYRLFEYSYPQLVSANVSGEPPLQMCSYSFRLLLDSLPGVEGEYLQGAGYVWQVRGCPANASATATGEACRCDIGYQEDPTRTSCEAASPEPPMCPTVGERFGHPILPATAEKYRFEEDLVDGGPSPLSFSRIYRSSWALNKARLPTGMGRGWAHNHEMVLSARPAVLPAVVTVTAPEGHARGFSRAPGSTSWTASTHADRLAATPDGGWLYTRADDDTTFAFDGAGRLLSRTERNGWVTRYTRDASGRLTTIGNAFGRSLTLTYDSDDDIASVTTSDLRSVRYGYDTEGRLRSIQDPSGRTRGLLYEHPTLPFALTGLVDENDARFATFDYDAAGHATGTELAGAVERYEVAYPAMGQAVVTDPLGTRRTFEYATAAGQLAVTSGSLPSGTGGAAEAATREQDANGLITREVDFQGVATTTTWDTARRLPLVVTRAAGTPEATTTTTEWHPSYALPAKVIEAGRTTSYTYGERGQLLSQTLSQPGQADRVRRWTYTDNGLMASETAPNGAVTRYAYDAEGNRTQATDALGHVTRYAYDRAARLTSQTAPNGLVTTYTWDAQGHLLSQTVGDQQTTTYTYTASGEVATMSRPDGLVVTYAFDGAHRVTGWRNNRGETASFTLDRMGNRTAEQITDANGAVAWSRKIEVNAINRLAKEVLGGDPASDQKRSFAYDRNGERVAETDALNQTTRYGLDALRRVESISQLIWWGGDRVAKRSHDAAGDVVRATDFEGVATEYIRDAQGNATSETSADTGSRTTQYDALGLPVKIVDALGQATIIERDALGRPTAFTYADGQSATLRYDLSGAAYNVGGTPTASVGYLSEVTDRSGTTVYQRDAFGRVVRKTQTLANGMTHVLATSYTAAGQIDVVTYPGAADQQLRHVYDAMGRLVRMDWNSRPLLTNISWTPLGQPAGWTWAGGNTTGGISIVTARTYDTAGRLTQVSVGGQTVLDYTRDEVGNITALELLSATPVVRGDANAALVMQRPIARIDYDAFSRPWYLFHDMVDTTMFAITDLVDHYTVQDVNGNRTFSEILQRAPYTPSQIYKSLVTERTYETAGNRITGFGQMAALSNPNAPVPVRSTVTTHVAYTHDANGALTSDGLHRFNYDATGRLTSITTGTSEGSPTTRYAHNALGQRVFKTEPVYPGTNSEKADDTSLTAFFARLWNWATSSSGSSGSDAERMGYAYVYDEQGTLMGEYGAGGAKSAGSRQYIYLPTPAGPMPVASVQNQTTLQAITADHLNTPRHLTSADGTLLWEWPISLFGEEPPKVLDRRFNRVAAVEGDLEFNLRYPGQYFDKESGLHYNGFRTYDPQTGRYTQGDPIGLDGGWNRFGYAGANPLAYTDPSGLIEIPNPNGVVPGGPWTPHDGNRPGQFLGAKPSGGGGPAQCQFVPDEANGGPPGSKGYWKTNQHGQKGWQRYDLEGNPGDAEDMHRVPVPRILGIVPLFCPLCGVVYPDGPNNTYGQSGIN